jgi:hypothetical protein
MAAPEAPRLAEAWPFISRRRLFGTAAALLGSVSIAKVAAQDATPDPEASPEGITSGSATPDAMEPDPLPFLFIQTSEQGSWSAVRGQPGAFWLTMINPSPQTIVIQDEPTNAAGAISTALFFDSIYINDTNPLQAVISAQTATGDDVLTVSLFRASYDPTAGELSYIAATLNTYDDVHGVIPLQSQTGNFTLPPSFGATSVFIANAFCRSANGSTCQFG